MTKKRRITAGALVIVFIIAVAIGAIFYIDHVDKTLPTSGEPMPLKQVVIDPGHGGEDGGAQVLSLVEKELNLDIANTLSDMMKAAGFEVIMTRTEDISIYDEDEKSLRNKKRSDILNRLEIANSNPDAIMVSIHQNKFSQSQYWGAQMFYGKNNDWSKPLAQSIQDSFVAQLQPENERQIKPISSDVYLIKNAKTPAVLVECGFLSNPKEAKKLNDANYRKQVAFTIYCGIMNFYQANQ